ncbi:hypothetical protein [Leifsonia sp. Root4]|uniref:hypothetical protein n=1 Tax=Leifsonia sp. Root4 TaxID=1736525 RepID=UPI000AA4150A|nr:hypothetical protein [Leifsonia sp. Root4]
MTSTSELLPRSLPDDATGRYVVTTVSGSRYRFDLDVREVRRDPGSPLAGAPALRRDGESVDLLEIVSCTLGEPLVVLINLAVPGVWLTTRESTAVASIERVPELPRRHG